MPLIVRIVAGAPEAFIDFTDGFVIAVDKGLEHCHKNNIKADLAVGDFDSYEQEVTIPRINLKPEKDETDLFVALQEAIRMNPDKIYLYGSTNGRLDHYLANINLLGLYDITMIDETNRIYVADGQFEVKTDRYVSFFHFAGNPVISLKGFKYPLKDYKLLPKDNLCVSNEVIDTGLVSVKDGRVLVIESK